MTDAPPLNPEERRLVRMILARKGQPDFIIADATSQQQQALLSATDNLFEKNGITPAYIDLSRGEGVGAVMKQLAEYAAAGVDVVHLTGGGDWLRGREPFNDGTAARADILNIQRENLFRIPVKTILWLAPDDIATLASTAPDLWAWRAGIYDLSAPAAAPVQKMPAAPAGPK